MKGRPRHLDRPILWNISLPESLATKIELLLWDPTANGPRKGSKSALICGLLERYLKEKGEQKNGSTSNV